MGFVLIVNKTNNEDEAEAFYGIVCRSKEQFNMAYWNMDSAFFKDFIYLLIHF